MSAYANYIEGLAKGGSAPMTNGGQVVSNAGQVFAPYVSRQKEVGLKYDGGNIGASASFFTTSMPSAYVQNNVYGYSASSATAVWSSMCSASPSRACACSAA